MTPDTTLSQGAVKIYRVAARLTAHPCTPARRIDAVIESESRDPETHSDTGARLVQLSLVVVWLSLSSKTHGEDGAEDHPWLQERVYRWGCPSLNCEPRTRFRSSYRRRHFRVSFSWEPCHNISISWISGVRKQATETSRTIVMSA